MLVRVGGGFRPEKALRYEGQFPKFSLHALSSII